LFNKPAVTDGVSRIIDSVLGALLLNPDRTFTFADMVRVGTGSSGRAGSSRVLLGTAAQPWQDIHSETW
jgi:hypothetical protein